MRWVLRYQAYLYLLTDVYPPFTLDDVPEYPVRLAIPERQRLNRAAVFFRFILAIPGMIVSTVATEAPVARAFRRVADRARHRPAATAAPPGAHRAAQVPDPVLLLLLDADPGISLGALRRRAGHAARGRRLRATGRRIRATPPATAPPGTAPRLWHAGLGVRHAWRLRLGYGPRRLRAPGGYGAPAATARGRRYSSQRAGS